VTADNFDELLEDKFGLQRADMVAAMELMPPIRPYTAGLTDHDARLLDEAGFTAEPAPYAEVITAALAHTARLLNTAATVDEVAAALGVNESRIRQRRLDHSLWAIDVDNQWLFPVMQFEEDHRGSGRRQIRGLDQVFKALPHDLHPVAVAGFLTTPQPNLALNGHPTSPVIWLGSGGDVAAVLDLVEAARWAS
jgi:hypothetical protein